MDFTYHGKDAVYVPKPNSSDVHGIATIWRSRLSRRRKTVCKSSLGQLPATEFDIDVKTLTRSSAACMRILMVSARTHDGRTFALTVLVLVSQSLIQSKHTPRRLQTTKRSVCANVRHALQTTGASINQSLPQGCQ